MSGIVKFMKDEDGVVAIEYVIIAAALVGVLAAVFTGMGSTLTTKLGTIVDSIGASSGGTGTGTGAGAGG